MAPHLARLTGPRPVKFPTATAAAKSPLARGQRLRVRWDIRPDRVKRPRSIRSTQRSSSDDGGSSDHGPRGPCAIRHKHAVSQPRTCWPLAGKHQGTRQGRPSPTYAASLHPQDFSSVTQDPPGASQWQAPPTTRYSWVPVTIVRRGTDGQHPTAGSQPLPHGSLSPGARPPGRSNGRAHRLFSWAGVPVA